VCGLKLGYPSRHSIRVETHSFNEKFAQCFLFRLLPLQLLVTRYDKYCIFSVILNLFPHSYVEGRQSILLEMRAVQTIESKTLTYTLSWCNICLQKQQPSLNVPVGEIKIWWSGDSVCGAIDRHVSSSDQVSEQRRMQGFTHSGAIVSNSSSSPSSPVVMTNKVSSSPPACIQTYQ
jgi:hypothetical protein